MLCRLFLLLIFVTVVSVTVIVQRFYEPLDLEGRLDFDDDRSIVVTGANAGLGFATVQLLAHNPKARIIMGCRSMKRCTKAADKISSNPKAKALLIPLEVDLTKKASMESFAEEVTQFLHTTTSDNGGIIKLDALVNNAGIFSVSTFPTYLYGYNDGDVGTESHIGVNHLGAVYMTHLLWRYLLNANGGARVVAVSSPAGTVKSVTTKDWFVNQSHVYYEWTAATGAMEFYKRSKRANLMFASELHERYYETTKIASIASHPGYTSSSIVSSGLGSGSGENKLRNLLKAMPLSMPASLGAMSQALAAVIGESNQYFAPKYFLYGDPMIVGKTNVSAHHVPFSRQESSELWDMTMEVLKIKEFGVVNIKKIPNTPMLEEKIQQFVQEKAEAYIKENVEQLVQEKLQELQEKKEIAVEKEEEGMEVVEETSEVEKEEVKEEKVVDEDLKEDTNDKKEDEMKEEASPPERKESNKDDIQQESDKGISTDAAAKEEL